MKKIIDDYSLKEILGQGMHGQVYKAINMKTNLEVAIKVIPIKKFHDIPKLEEFMINQIKILSDLNKECDYIVKYFDMLKTSNNFYFVYQYCNGGTLSKLLNKQGKLSQRAVVVYLKQFLEAFQILSKRNIMHRDLKPENILFHNGIVRIADFGFCKLLNDKDDLAQTMLGSPLYMAPQVLKGQIYTIKADIWSLGVVVYQMLFGSCPFQSKTIASLIKVFQVHEVSFPQSPKISKVLEDFLKKCLVKDYRHRISWEQLFATFQITDQGQLINKKQLMIPIAGNGELRSSITNNQAQRIHNYTSNYPPSYRNTINYTNNQIMNLNSPKKGPPNQFLQPQYKHDVNDPNTIFMNRKSPVKIEEHNADTNNNGRNYPQGNNLRPPQIQLSNNNKYDTYNVNTNGKVGDIDLYKNSQMSTISEKTDLQKTVHEVHETEKGHINEPFDSQMHSLSATMRVPTMRIEMLAKNHSKILQINQLVLDVYHQEYRYGKYIGYLIFVNFSRELQILYDKIKENRNYSSHRDLKALVQSETESITAITQNFLSFFKQFKESKDQGGQSGIFQKSNSFHSPIDLQKGVINKKFKILLAYVESLQDSDQDIRLASRIVDYLVEGNLIKKDAYDRMSKEYLLKQMRNKLARQQP